jgi:hypothetical protein
MYRMSSRYQQSPKPPCTTNCGLAKHFAKDFNSSANSMAFHRNSSANMSCPAPQEQQFTFNRRDYLQQSQDDSSDQDSHVLPSTLPRILIPLQTPPITSTMPITTWRQSFQAGWPHIS